MAAKFKFGIVDDAWTVSQFSILSKVYRVSLPCSFRVVKVIKFSL